MQVLIFSQLSATHAFRRQSARHACFLALYHLQIMPVPCQAIAPLACRSSMYIFSKTGATNIVHECLLNFLFASWELHRPATPNRSLIHACTILQSLRCEKRMHDSMPRNFQGSKTCFMHWYQLSGHATTLLEECPGTSCSIDTLNRAEVIPYAKQTFYRAGHKCPVMATSLRRLFCTSDRSVGTAHVAQAQPPAGRLKETGECFSFLLLCDLGLYNQKVLDDTTPTCQCAATRRSRP